MALSLDRVVNNTEVKRNKSTLSKKVHLEKVDKKRPWQGRSLAVINSSDRKQQYLMSSFNGEEKDSTKSFLFELMN